MKYLLNPLVAKLNMLTLATALIFAIAASAQETGPTAQAPAGPCAAPEHRQFDFWVGEWTVMTGEQLAGRNSVRLLHGGCVLQENWQGTGEGGISGSSFNIYDRSSGRWHQTWVDASGTLLLIDGGLVDGVMELSGKRAAPDGGGEVLHRIRWTPNEDGTVRQHWEVSSDAGANWSTLFDGLYTRADVQP
jgi:hypothetical protein